MHTQETSKEELKKKNYEAYIDLVSKEVEEQERYIALVLSGVQARKAQKRITKLVSRGHGVPLSVSGGKSPVRVKNSNSQSFSKTAADIKKGCSLASEKCEGVKDVERSVQSSPGLCQSLQFKSGSGCSSLDPTLVDGMPVVSLPSHENPSHLYFFSDASALSPSASVDRSYQAAEQGDRRAASSSATSVDSLGICVSSPYDMFSTKWNCRCDAPSHYSSLVSADHTKPRCICESSVTPGAFPVQTLCKDLPYSDGPRTKVISSDSWVNGPQSYLQLEHLPNSHLICEKFALTPVQERHSSQR